MLQTDFHPYASDALEDAMRLAQVKALNSYNFSDCLTYLNYAWADIYCRIAQMDTGFYSTNMRITKKLTKIPPYVKNTIHLYNAPRLLDCNRMSLRESGMADLVAPNTYNISGFELYCPDAQRYTIWMEYVPMQQQIFFTHHNRDPKVYPEHAIVQSTRYNLYDLVKEDDRYILRHRNPTYSDDKELDYMNKEDWEIKYISCNFPYIFVTYTRPMSEEYISGYWRDSKFTEYNPFDYTGRPSDVEYMECHWNDKTGMGVVVLDHADNTIKELGWTPDTMLIYPSPEAYRFLVAKLADKLAALNESEIMGVQKELVESQYAFDLFLHKNKSSWGRIDNVNRGWVTDWL